MSAHSPQAKTLPAATVAAWLAATVAATTPAGPLVAAIAVAITTAALLDYHRRDELALIAYGANTQSAAHRCPTG